MSNFKKKRIWVVSPPDDGLGDLIEHALDGGYWIERIELGRDLEAMELDHPDCLVIDCGIGSELASAWGEAMPFKTAVIAIRPEAEPGVRPAWANDHFNRPFDPVALAARIEGLCHRRLDSC